MTLGGPLFAESSFLTEDAVGDPRSQDWGVSDRERNRATRSQDALSEDQRKRQSVERYLDFMKQSRGRSDGNEERERALGSGRKSRVVTPDYERDYERSYAPNRSSYGGSADTFDERREQPVERSDRRISDSPLERKISDEIFNNPSTRKKDDDDYLKGFRFDDSEFINGYQENIKPKSPISTPTLDRPNNNREPSPGLNGYFDRKPASTAPRDRDDRSLNESLYKADRQAVDPFDAPSSERNSTHEALLKVKNLAHRFPQRNPNSAHGSLEEDEDPYSDPSESFIGLRLGLLGGISRLSSSDANVQETLSAQETDQNGYVGLLADINVGRYLGAEIDGFFGIAPTMILVDDSNNETEVSVRHSGMMAHLRAQLPLPLGNFQLTPFVGVGYGFIGLKSEYASLTTDSTTGSAGTDMTEESTVKGPYWTGGVMLFPSGSLILSADYSSSFSATADGSNTLNSGGSATENGQFSRIRVAGYVRVTPKFLIGAQYIQREMTALSIGTGLAPTAVSEDTAAGSMDTRTLKQILGVLMVEF